MNNFEAIFNNAPICIWEEDWSEVKTILDEIRPTVSNNAICEYLSTHPDFVEKLIAAVKIIKVNQRTIELYEAESQEHLIKSLRETFVPESLYTFKNEIRNLYIGNMEFEEEAITQSLNGNLRYIIIYVKFPSEASEYKNVILTMVDITSQKTKHKQAIQKNSEKYKQLIEATHTAYMILDSQGNIKEANDTFKEMLSCGEKCMCPDKNIRSMVNNISISDFDSAWKSIMQGRTIINLELSLHYENVSKWVNMNVSLIENGEKKIFCLMTDISRRKIEEQKKMIEKERHKDSLKKHILQLRSKIKEINSNKSEVVESL